LRGCTNAWVEKKSETLKYWLNTFEDRWIGRNIDSDRVKLKNTLVRVIHFVILSFNENMIYKNINDVAHFQFHIFLFVVVANKIKFDEKCTFLKLKMFLFLLNIFLLQFMFFRFCYFFFVVVFNIISAHMFTLMSYICTIIIIKWERRAIYVNSFEQGLPTFEWEMKII
jgi:hypothetical protein